MKLTKEQSKRIYVALRVLGNVKAVLVADEGRWKRKKALKNVADCLHLQLDELIAFLESDDFSRLCTEISAHWPHLLQ